MQWIKYLFVATVVSACALAAVALWIVADQGIDSTKSLDLGYANVSFDDFGIPTIESTDWEKLVQAQGYITAAERLWQMELTRRFASGRLSGLFGPKTLAYDSEVLKENWRGIASASLANLTSHERKFCQAYADGVNQFIQENGHAWGLEFTIMRETPAEWTCVDSLLVVLYMTWTLTATADEEGREFSWREHLSEEWQELLFPKYHQWAAPIFGSANEPYRKNPPQDQAVPSSPILDKELTEEQYALAHSRGSNAWVWSNGETSLLANDPHLTQSVPQIWYAIRLRVKADEWVVGASLPGLPGVVIGMNPAFAWGFTNQGDDVDDYLEEILNKDETEYLAATNGGSKIWRRIVKKDYKIQVRGDPEQKVEGWFTHRGPVSKRKWLGNRHYSRVWLPMRKSMLTLPVMALNQARSWDEFNRAIDRMFVPAQAILFSSRDGAIGFRSSGVEIERQADNRLPVSAIRGEWKGISVKDQRRVLYENASKAAPRFLANANAQIWNDPYGHRWASDDRRRRIATLLREKSDFSVDDMARMQRDTYSEFFVLFRDWLLANGGDALSSPDLRKQLETWDGYSDSNGTTFAALVKAEEYLTNCLLARVKSHFLGGKNLPTYKFPRRRAFILRVLESDLFPLFGTTRTELAGAILRNLQKSHAAMMPFESDNAWRAQHPFVGNVPVLGLLLKIDEFKQSGFTHLVKVEEPKRGASMRVVWNLQNLSDSRWIFPVGQSGHVRSGHFKDQHKLWFSGQTIPIFDEKFAWR